MATKKTAPTTTSSNSAAPRLARTSIHTPLKPASVQDLKAKFDSSKQNAEGKESDNAVSSKSPLTDRKDTQRSSFGKGSSAVARPSAAGVTLSSVSSSLHSAAQRRKDAASKSSTLGSSSSSSTSDKTTHKSSLTLTTARPFTTSSTSTSSSISSSSLKTSTGLSSRSNGSKSTCFNRGSSNGENNSNSFEKDTEGRIELPVMHITGSGSDVKVSTGAAKFSSKLIKNDDRSSLKRDESKGAVGSKVNNFKSSFEANKSPKTSPRGLKSIEKSESPPPQRTNKLVAREITIERLDSGMCVTSYKDQNSSKTSSSDVTTKPNTAGKKIREIKVQNITTTSSSSDPTETSKEDLPFRKVKLRNTKEQVERQASKDNLIPKSTEPKSSELLRPNNDMAHKRISRKMSNERFERLKFDFERGVAPEYSPKTADEDPDHVLLQQKARQLSIDTDAEDVPIISKKTKEESIFKEGLKVSDFVKQVNKLNPEPEVLPKWKLQKRNSQTSSAASSDVGGETAGEISQLPDSLYEGIPGEDLTRSMIEADAIDGGEDDDDEIYEKVNIPKKDPDQSQQDTDQDGTDSSKAPGRRLGVYRKNKGDKKREQEIISQSKAAEDSDQDLVIHSDGEDGWDDPEGERSGSGTDYEDVVDPEAGSKQSDNASGNKKGKKIKHKLKKIFVNNKGQKEKKKKQKGDAETVATDSEGEFIDDPDEYMCPALGTFSRTSSERSSGRLTGQSNQTSTASLPAAETAPAPPPPKDSTMPITPGIVTESSSEDGLSPPPIPPHSSVPAPPLPPRSSRNLTQVAENSPPLPPRNANKTTLSVSLDTVIPVSPPGSKRNSRSDMTKDRFSFHSQDGSDSGCSTGRIEYIDYDPALNLERTDKDRKSTASTSSRASTSSSYMYPDISAFPELKGGSGEDSLYVDLEDEQIYGRASDIYVSKFESEPLYQWYSKDKVIQNIRSNQTMSSGYHSDEEYLDIEKERNDDKYSVYEDVERLLEKDSSSLSHAHKPPASDSSSSNISNSSQEELGRDLAHKPQRRSVIEDVFKNGGTLHRALWCQMPEVIDSGLLQKLTDQEKKIQEAMFEIMTSEASYLKSLKILIKVFVSAPEFASDHSDRCVITRRDRTVLFSNIGSIKDISSNFLSELESLWQKSIEQEGVCDVIVKHASKNFEPYVRYCCNQAFQDRCLTSLKQNTEFSETVKRLEQRPECQFLPLGSFLLLPMQRITRLPLLVDAICHRLEPGTAQHARARKAFESLTKVAKQCDEAAKKIQQAEQMCLLAKSLEFKIKEFPIVSASRFLVKQGELTLIKGEGTVRKPLSKLLGSNKEHVYLLLFNDILLLTKKKGNFYQVRDYCQRNSLHVEAIDNPEKSRHIGPGMATGLSNLLFLALLANHDNKQVELVLACKLESERSRWIDAIVPAQASSDTERIYDVWDCPQVQCIKKYLATQPDEITLEESDVVNVNKKLTDGWYMGERIRDGAKGWFLASHTEEINNSHVRARNLRLRYRLMMASEEYAHMEFDTGKR